ncbi:MULTISPECIES: pyridoxamine 5'-phosphate oxidase family protein [unclassified Janthinobacterium]|uniref:pyridoxamine 5'-phosphate oxidase family protein n=1 Tax=unclassified Janthinobacterium TaxID=2610881 RepID=UPI000345BAB8|nr:MULTISPECIES: pyridoxamine 5'-phosphate oxidase family protein [unclassified Janthinobacterium]MEC5161428.1 general stress protein 26 [Janthinobacterium sp. CG_S6]
MTQFAQDQLDAIKAKIKHVEFGMLTTSNVAGRLTSRPMTQQQIDGQGQIWFFTSDKSPFTHELQANPQVNVSFSDIKESLYVSVSGHAELLKDRAKAEEMWNPIVKAWFPEGLDDPHLALIKVSIETAEYWDSHLSKMAQLYAMAKAAVTGERPQGMGEHAKIDVNAPR